MSDLRPFDPFADVQDATRRHRAQHGCGAYTYSDGSLLGVIAAATKAARVVEVGTALGYTALWLAYASPDARVDTIDLDRTHVDLARDQILRLGYADRITVLHGSAEKVLATLDEGSYDVGFFDGFPPNMELLGRLRRLLRPGGVLVAANLTLGPAQSVIADLSDPGRWLMHSLGETAICVKQGDD